MNEATGNSPAIFKDTFHLYERESLSSGDTLYRPPVDIARNAKTSSQVITSQLGEIFLHEDTAALLTLLSNPQTPSVIQRRLVARQTDESVIVAVKYMTPATAAKIGDPPGVELFRAMRDLEGEGFSCAIPVAATNDVYISLFAEGSQPSLDDIEYRKYMLQLMDIRDKLVSVGTWPPMRVIDITSGNVLRRKPVGENSPFVIIDPIAQTTNTSHAAEVIKHSREAMRIE